MDTQNVSLLDSYFNFIYAREMMVVMHTVFKRMCDGCIHGNVSQREHTCLLPIEQLLKTYFDDVVRELDELSIIRKWYQTVLLIPSMPSSLVDMYKLKLDCLDWRETDMKCKEWKSRMIRMILTIQQLDKRFY